MSKKERMLSIILAAMILNTNALSLTALADNESDSISHAAQTDAASSQEPEQSVPDSREPEQEQTESAVKAQKIADDGSENESEIINIADHEWGDWQVLREATVTQTGLKSHTCTHCGKVETMSVPKETIRLSGSNRYKTSMQIAQQLRKENGDKKFDSIIVSCGTDFADALSASYLAKVKNAPILIIADSGAKEMFDFIKENTSSAASVYIIGGRKAVSEGGETQVRKIFKGKDKVVRLSGKDR